MLEFNELDVSERRGGYSFLNMRRIRDNKIFFIGKMELDGFEVWKKGHAQTY